MITQTTIDRINSINDLRLSFETTITTIETPLQQATQARVYMDLVVKELSLDVLKRDGQ
jgi:hypothetical protein